MVCDGMCKIVCIGRAVGSLCPRGVPPPYGCALLLSATPTPMRLKFHGIPRRAFAYSGKLAGVYIPYLMWDKIGAGRIAPRFKRQIGANTMEKITANNIAAASLSAMEAAAFLPIAAQAAIKGKAAIDVAKGKQAAALAVMVAGFSSDETAARKWSFDIKAGDDVHTHVECEGVDEFGNDDLAWKRNGEGKVSKVAQSAYKAALQHTFFNLATPVPAVWTMASKAIPMAQAIRAEGMTARIVDGALVLEGGSGERADKMRAAAEKSLTALGKVAGGETGTSRAAPQNNKGGEGEARMATPSEVLALATRLIEGAAKGEEALCGSALSYARRIAALVAANPEAFAED